VPFERDQHARAGDRIAVRREKIALGLATPLSPFSVIAKTPISLTAPNRFLIARTRRKLECVSPSK
jgi:hypothetical protein